MSLPITPSSKHVERPLDLSEDVGRIGISLNQPLSIIGIGDPAGPAADAGLRTFDWVVAASGKPTRRWVELSARARSQPRLAGAADVAAAGARCGAHSAACSACPSTQPRVATLTPEPGEAKGSLRAGLEPSDLYISHVMKASAEARIGLQVGDRIVALDDQPIRHSSALLEQLEAERGKAHQLTVRRNGELRTVRYTLARQRAVNDYKSQRPLRDRPAPPCAHNAVRARQQSGAHLVRALRGLPRHVRGGRADLHLHRAPAAGAAEHEDVGRTAARSTMPPRTPRGKVRSTICS